MNIPRLAGTIHIDHPGYGQPPRVSLAVDRGLKGGKLDIVPLSEAQLLDLIESAAKALRVLRAH